MLISAVDDPIVLDGVDSRDQQHIPYWVEDTFQGPEVTDLNTAFYIPGIENEDDGQDSSTKVVSPRSCFESQLDFATRQHESAEQSPSRQSFVNPTGDTDTSKHSRQIEEIPQLNSSHATLEPS